MKYTPGSEARERDRQVESAAEHLARSGGDAAGVLLLTGPRGIGKSRFARDVLARMPPGLECLVATPPLHDPRGRFTPWLRILRRLAMSRPAGRAANHLELVGSDWSEPLDVMVDEIVLVLTEEHRRTPYVVLLDDVDRFDPASLAVLDALSSSLTTSPISVVACCTVSPAMPHETAALVTALVSRQGVEHVALRPLADDVLGKLVAQQAPHLALDERDELVRLSLGNPQLAIELARAGDPAAATAPGSLVGRLLADQVRTLGGHHVLEALALLGRPATVSLLAAAAGIPVTVASGTIDNAVSAGVVRTSGDVGMVHFASPIIEAAVRAGVGPIVARDLHRRLAEVVAPTGLDEGPAAVERARHLLAAGETGDVVARSCLAACLHEERRGSSQAAEDLALYGLDLADAADETRVGLMCALARLHFTAGYTRRAIEEAHHAVLTARQCDRHVFVQAVTDLAWVDPRVVDVEPGRRELYEEALADPSCPTDARAVLLGRLALTMLLPDFDAARTIAAEALAAADDCQSQRATEAARAAWFSVTYRLDAADHLRAEGERLSRLGHDRTAAGALFATALADGDRARVDAMVEQVKRESARLGFVTSRRMLDAVQLGLAVCDGDADAVTRHAAALAEHGTTDLQSLAMPLVMLWFAHTGLDVPLPTPFAISAPPSSDLVRLATLTMVAASALAAGATDVSAVRALSEPRDLLLRRHVGPYTDLVPALAALVGGVLKDAQLCLTALEHLGRHQGRFLLLQGVVPLAPVGWLLAWAHAGAGDGRAALRANEAALTVSRSARFDVWTALCLLQRATLLQHSAPVASARAAREAEDFAQRKGLDLISRLAHGLIGTSGRPRSPLSPTQEETLRLAAAGLTNDAIARRLGVSVSTIEKHLSQVYRKLGLPNRAAAARWFTDRS